MSIALGLLLVVILVAVNGFFVAAEFSLVSANRQAIDELAEQGSRRARAARAEMSRLSFMLSGAQFGITVSSLLLGYVAEPAFAGILRPVTTAFGLPERTALGVSLVVALFVSTVFQMVVGELAPKNLAISVPQRTALAVAVPTRIYSVVFGPIIRLFDSSANVLSRLVGVEPQAELLGGYSADEFARIIEASSEEGQLPEEKATLLLRAVELGERRISEIMVPRPDVEWLHVDAPLDALRGSARRTGYSRFPVRGNGEDDVVGTVHIKDLLDVDVDRRADATVRDIVYEALVVPESHTIRRLLRDLRARHRTFAVVVDEYGSVAGIVTLEDVLEAIVGEIEDEFDPGTPSVRRIGVGRYLLPGRMRVARLEELTATELDDGDFETVAGFIIDRLGHIPAEGETVEEAGWRFHVTGVEGNRVTELTLERQDGT